MLGAGGSGSPEQREMRAAGKWRRRIRKAPKRAFFDLPSSPVGWRERLSCHARALSRHIGLSKMPDTAMNSKGHAVASSPLPIAGRNPDPIVRSITVSEIVKALAEGLRDFQSAPVYGLTFGALYAAGASSFRSSFNCGRNAASQRTGASCQQKLLARWVKTRLSLNQGAGRSRQIQHATSAR